MALVVILSFAACASEDYTDDPIFDQEIKTELADKGQLPEWLADYVSYLEYVPVGQELPTEKSGVYRFQWNGQTYYELYSPSQSALHEEVYTVNGIPFQLEPADYKNFSDNVHNWTIVYIMRQTHEMAGYFYPRNTPDSVNTFFERAFSEIRSDIHGFKFQFVENASADCYIINSKEQLYKIHMGIDQIPEIDFENNTLILGVVKASNRYNLKRQEYGRDRLYIAPYGSIYNAPTLSLLFEERKDWKENEWEEDIINHYFWAFYPKIINGEMMLRVIMDNQFQEAVNYVWQESRIPSVPDPSQTNIDSDLITEVLPNPDTYFFDRDTTDWIIHRDETGRITDFTCFQVGNDKEEKLYGCPSCLGDVKYLFPLSEGNEIRLIDVQKDAPNDCFPHFMGYGERYKQYYKDVPVSSDSRFYYLLTPEGKRMTYAWFHFYDIKDLDVNPDITKQQAMEIFSNYTNQPIEDYWKCTDLYIDELDKQRLVYDVTGPYAPWPEDGSIPIVAPTYFACIDAHTGEIIRTNYNQK
jgi:hypothetical protein